MVSWFRSKNIHHILAHPPLKASLAENAIRRLKKRVYLHMRSKKTKRYIDVLPQLVQGLNTKYIASIGMTPQQVFQSDNSVKVYKRLRKKKAVRKSSEKKLKIGTLCRIVLTTNVFNQRIYSKRWSDGLFKILRVFNTVPYTYEIADKEGVVLAKRYYANELSLFLDDE